MAVGAQISLEEYLHTMYRPDCDYVDGVVEERNLGELDHGLAQTRLAHFFMGLFRQTGLLPMTEVRMRVKPDKISHSGCRSHSRQARRADPDQTTAALH